MSFRIKIPSKTRETSTSSQPSSEAASVKRRTASKRRYIDTDDEDDDDSSAQAAPVSQRSLPQSKRVKTIEPEDYFAADNNDDDDEMMIDIEGDGEPSAADDTSFPPEQFTRSPSPKRSTSDSKPLRRGTSSKKKRHVVYSDDEDDFNVEADVIHDAGAQPFPDDDDDDFEPEPSSRKAASSSRAKGPGKGKAGKHPSSTTKGSKGKTTKEKEKEIVMKDERKLPPLKSESSAPSIKRPRPKSPPKDEDEVVDPVAAAPEVEPSTTTANTPGDTALLAIPKKRKLPTIRKTKPAGSAAVTPTAVQTPAPPKPPVTSTKSTDDLSQITTPSTVPRKPAALLGSTDFDLRNASVYAELFNPGGAGPRSGLNRKEKEEERRKELNKMRDEARAKRAEETKNTFDLQSQADKISRFEDRLRQSGSLALHPNFLAAKFRDDYERERKRQRDKDKESGGIGKEEGEA